MQTLVTGDYWRKKSEKKRKEEKEMKRRTRKMKNHYIL